LLDQCASEKTVDIGHVLDTLGLAGTQELLSLVEKVSLHDTVSALCSLDELYNNGKDMASLLNEMALLVRDLLVFKLSPDSGLISTGFDRDVLSELSGKLSPERLFFCLDVLKNAIAGLPRGGSSKLTVEMCLIRMCDERLSDDTVALLSRVSQLETGSARTVSATVNNAGKQKNAAPLTDRVSADVVKKQVVEQTVDFREPTTNEAESTTDITESTTYEPEQTTDITKSTTYEPEQTAAFEEPTTEVAELTTELAVDTPIASSSNESCDLWTGIVNSFRNEPAIHALLGDGSKVRAHQQDESLIISVADFFTANMVEAEYSGLLKDAAKNISGRNLLIRVEVNNDIDNASDEGKRSNLESLSAFGVVNFE